MKLRFNRQEMSDALTAVGQVAATRTTKPLLECVRIDAHSDFVVLSATDLELSIRYVVTQVEVETPGEVLARADTLARIVRECSDDLLAFEAVSSVLHIRGGDSHFQVVTQDVADFPPVPTMDGDPDFKVGSALLHRLVEWTSFAAARESTRYAINGVLWKLEGTRLTLAATDGRRLALASGDTEGDAPGEPRQAIVPAKALAVLGRLPVDADTPVAVQITSNQMVLDMGRATLGTALVEGHFPKYEDVIPSDCDRRVDLNTLEFQSALKRAALLTNEESKGVRLAFSDGNLTLSSRAPEQGEATVALPIEYHDETVEIGFNPVFLLDVLRVVHTDTLRFEFKEANRPGVVRVGSDFVYVVMPVSLS